MQVKFTTRDRWNESPHFDINGKSYFLAEVSAGLDQWRNARWEWELWCRETKIEKLHFSNVCDVCNWFCGTDYKVGGVVGNDKHEDKAYYLLRRHIVWKYRCGDMDYKPTLACVLDKGGELYIWRYAENSLTRFYEPQKILSARPYKEAVEAAAEYIEKLEGEQSLF